MLYIMVCIFIKTSVCFSDLCAWIGKLFFPHAQRASDGFQNAVVLLYPVSLCVWVLMHSVGFVGIFG